MKKEFKEKLVVSKELFYNESTMYGAYGFKFEGKPNHDVKVHPIYHNFSIVGNTPPLEEGNSYDIHFKEEFDERRQMDTYVFIEVKSNGIKGRTEQAKFLKEVLPAKQAKNILTQFNGEDIIGDILNDRIDLTEVKGIKEATAMIIKDKLENTNEYSEAIIKLSPLGVGIKNVVQLSEHFGSPERLLKVVEENIYRLTEVKGFGFKRIDEYALNKGIQKNDKRRIISGALYVIEQLVSFGDTKISIDKFEEELVSILDIEEVDEDTFNKILSNNEIFYEEGFISLIRYRNEEKAIVEHLRRLRDNFVYQKLETESIIKSVEKTQGFNFNKEQLEGIEIATQNGVFILDGKAGSGKTSLLKAAVECIGGYNKSCSLSGKAANVLSQNGLDASTIHRLLVWEPTGEFHFNADNQLLVGTYILDEASMVNNGLFLDLISAIPNGSQLLIVGDSGQLPAIGRGAIFDYLLSSTEFARATLTEVHRQAQDSGTLSNANMIRDGIQIVEQSQQGLTVEGVNEDFYGMYYYDKTDILPQVEAIAERYRDNPDTNNHDFQVITGLKEKGELSVKNLNNVLQEIFNPSKHAQEEVQNTKYVFRQGDKVIQQGNNYKAIGITQEDFTRVANGLIDVEEANTVEEQVFNGSFGKVLSCVKGVGLLVKVEDVTTPILYLEGEDKGINILELGYAISVHRSQGSGFKTLLVTVSFNDFMLLSRQFLYTALTRTIDRCFLLGETNAIRYAIKTDKGKSRKCFIGDFLK